MTEIKHINDITRDVIGVAMRIHSKLGPGLLESVYETVLAGRLLQMGYHVSRQRPIDIEFEDLRFAAAFPIDLLIDERLILEIKSVEKLHPLHAKQLLTYLRLMKLPVGLILNFGESTMKEGIRRLVNDHIDPVPSAPLRETCKS
jgi:GxxExxY protein